MQVEHGRWHPMQYFRKTADPSARRITARLCEPCPHPSERPSSRPASFGRSARTQHEQLCLPLSSSSVSGVCPPCSRTQYPSERCRFGSPHPPPGSTLSATNRDKPTYRYHDSSWRPGSRPVDYSYRTAAWLKMRNVRDLRWPTPRCSPGLHPSTRPSSSAAAVGRAPLFF